MKEELTIEIAYRALNEFFHSTPFLLFGSGSSCAVDPAFGMEGLKNHLRNKFPIDCLSASQRQEWNEALDKLEQNVDLENYTRMGHMDEMLVQAYIWQEVIHRAFSPRSVKDKKSWLRLYQGSLVSYWEVSAMSSPVENPSGSITGKASSDTIEYTYCIHPKPKFSVRMYSITAADRALIWLHDVDETYFCLPDQKLLDTCNLSGTAMDEFRKKPKDYMANVVDGLIVHPAVHQHIISPFTDHEIRVGGGIKNPYLYLFQLRYQLIPDSMKRIQERERLIHLSVNEIVESNALQISAQKLMKTS